MPRILVADDHSLIRRSVRHVLENQEGWEVCAEATTGREAVAMTAATRPDIVVLDFSMPDLDGLQAARLIHEQFPRTAMIILSAHDEPELMDLLPAFGVRSWVLKSNPDQLVDAIGHMSTDSE